MAALMILGTIGVIGLVIMFGIPVLVKLAVFIGDMNAARQGGGKTDLIPPAPPTVEISYSATNSAVQNIWGYSESGARVVLTRNSKSVGSVEAGDDGRFEVRDVKLDNGSNLFIAVAVDPAGNKSGESRPINLKYLAEPPKLAIDYPDDGAEVTDSNRVEVVGKTDSNARLIINDRWVAVNANGEFKWQLALVSGENRLKIVAVDEAGNRTEKEMVVNYRP
ncbi:MAG: hypothetical protein G01um101416_506 [Microgenomates group bacterium Gr01-1014_16]|nr:MAG: hypothetical protein G01um101416_506 [Microgenomates group bacterium Gr01-1014_16]